MQMRHSAFYWSTPANYIKEVLIKDFWFFVKDFKLLESQSQEVS